MHTLLLLFLSLTAFLSFCLCFISQLGECLSVIITFAIKSKQRGWIEECMPDLAFSTPRVLQHVECYFDCCGVLFFLLFCFFQQMERCFFKGQIYWQSSCCEGSTSPRGLVSEWKPLLSIYSILTLQSLSLGLCVNEDDFMSRGKFDPVCENASADGTSEWYDLVNELHALICCSFIWAARGMTTISLLHRLLYVWWVPWREF